MGIIVLKDRAVAQKLGMCRSSIWAKNNPNSASYDPSFPQRVITGSRSVGWFEHEIDQWLEKQASDRKPQQMEDASC